MRPAAAARLAVALAGLVLGSILDGLPLATGAALAAFWFLLAILVFAPLHRRR